MGNTPFTLPIMKYSFFPQHARIFIATWIIASLAQVSHASSEELKIAATHVSQIIAHRGASAERPECTLASAKRAIEVGATATEVDVRTSKDGKLFILHDKTLDRTTNGAGIANALTLDQLQQLDAGSYFDKQYRNERIPSLVEMARLCRGKIDLLLDLKEDGEIFDQAVAVVIRENGDPTKTVIGVRSVEQAMRFRELLPEAKQLGLIPSIEDVEAYGAAGVEFIRIRSEWLAEGDAPANRVRGIGKKLHLTGVQGELKETMALLAHKPDSLGGDDPKKLLETLKKIATGESGI